MDSSRALAGLAHVSALLVSEDDLSGILATGMREASRVLGADGAGILVVVQVQGQLEVLASTSHAAADLAAYEAASSEGPCLDCIRENRVVEVHSAEEAEQRWPVFGAKMREAGYERAYSAPMRWQGDSVGGLHFFWRRADGGLDALGTQVMQTFADVMTVAVVHVHPPKVNLALERIQAALAARSLVEQAKGVLSHQRDLDMGIAYQQLLAIAEERGVTLGQAARLVVDSAQAGDIP